MDHGKTRADLCASGQQVRALPRAVGDDRKAGWTLSFEDLQDIRDAAGDWGYTLDLEAVENIALGVERRILAAQAPAPQAEGRDHRSFPDVADGRPMPPMGDDLMIAGLNGEDARFVAMQLAQNGLMLVPATPTAQEAVPACAACEDNPKPPNIPCAVCGAHPPQPSEAVAEALEEARSGLCAFAGGPDGACSETVKRIDAALRALKGGA